MKVETQEAEFQEGKDLQEWITPEVQTLSANAAEFTANPGNDGVTTVS
ncbi:hypothetical protein [Novosphingobium beihaiensis]|uniref:Uncharacterized protein n=1 Tax=Novosphingobium beihaiensis TaxID=2930389 RepID=A0ABT0BVY7_9SPHN|nr:hypothetical protein [Novosphingobium beihaiensis]MCJ2189231.1 hypothetical protein [Novosphingobium beihaiensis]